MFHGNASHHAPPLTGGRRIYVVAVHDSSLFTFCPPELLAALAGGDLWRAALARSDSLCAAFAGGDIKPAPGYFRSFQVDGYRFYINADGRLGLSRASRGGVSLLVPPPCVPEAPGILERSRPDWGELSPLATGVCPSGWVNFGMRKEIDRLIDESGPFHAALLMNTSRSTLPVRADIERAAQTFLESVRPEDEPMALSLSNWIHVDSEFTLVRSRLRSAITDSAARARSPYIGAETTKEPRRISPGVWDARGIYSRLTNEQLSAHWRFDGTRLYDALDLTLTERLNKIAGRKAILLFTDGVDTGSRLATSESTLARIEESDILLYVIKYDTPGPTAPYYAAYRVALDGFEAAYARSARNPDTCHPFEPWGSDRMEGLNDHDYE